MSSINTGSINVNYPIPGENNSSQGFRDNFAGIKSNLDTAANEITDLQSKAIVKSPLNGINIDNNMNNTLISNALIQGFRNTTYNLGNNLSGNLSINATNGDVQYGTITNSVSLGFSGWPPVGTYGQLVLILSVANTALASTITFPNQVDNSIVTIENCTGRTISFPKGATTLGFILTTQNCGSTISIAPINRPRRTTQLVTTVPTTLLGAPGDQPGDIATDASWVYVCFAPFNGLNPVWKRLALNGGGGGSVTSVDMTVPLGLNVTGRPITGSGTLAVTTSLNGIVSANGSGFTTVNIGSGLSYSGNILSATGGGSYTLPPATSSTLGGIKVGSGLSIAGDGTLSATGGGGGGSVSPATTSTLGGIIVGNGLSITSSGTLSVTGGSDAAFNTVFGTGSGGSFDQSGGLGKENTFFGYNSGDVTTTGYQNTAVGANALKNNTTGNLNTCVGFEALLSNTTGGSNTAFGRYALRSNTSGMLNVSVGPFTLYDCTVGSQNTAIGNTALIGVSSGGNNTGVGVGTGVNITTGSNNTLLGGFCKPSSATAAEQLVVGYDLIGKGDNTGYIGGMLGIYNEKNSASWDTTSDVRIKKNIADNLSGLDVIEKIRVRNFEYKKPEEITDLPSHCAVDKEGIQLGVIAQELQDILPECVTQNSTGALAVNTDNIIWHLVNAVKQLSEQIKELQKGQK